MGLSIYCGLKMALFPMLTNLLYKIDIKFNMWVRAMVSTTRLCTNNDYNNFRTDQLDMSMLRCKYFELLICLQTNILIYMIAVIIMAQVDTGIANGGRYCNYFLMQNKQKNY